MHEKYGPVVRLAPDELSFASAEAWRDIYGHRTGSQLHGQDEFPKYPTFYRVKGGARSIINEDRDGHALLRRQLSHGFSERSMREQEPIIGRYVDLLVRRLREQCVDSGLGTREPQSGELGVSHASTKWRPMDMTSWYVWATFDIIGDLAFGKPFGCLEQAGYHPWVAATTGAVPTTTFVISLKYLGLEFLVKPLAAIAMRRRGQHRENTRAKLRERMDLRAERPDLIEGLLKNKEKWVSNPAVFQIQPGI